MDEIKTEAVNVNISVSPTPMTNHYVPPVPTPPPTSTYQQQYKPESSKIEVLRFDNKDRQMIELDKCIRRLKKKCEKDNILKELKERQYYKKPSEVRREKAKNARRLMEKNRKKAELYNNGNGNSYYKGRKENTNGSRFGSDSSRTPVTRMPSAT